MVERAWLFCPHCDERLRNVREGPVRTTTLADLASRYGLEWVKFALGYLGFFPFLGLWALLVVGLTGGGLSLAVTAGFFLFLAWCLGASIAREDAQTRGERADLGAKFLAMQVVLGTFAAYVLIVALVIALALWLIVRPL
jgi:hypothetical protein